MVAYLQKPKGSEAFHQIVDFLNPSHIKYALIENPKIYISLIQQFWGTTTARTTHDGEVEITASIDGQIKTITEPSIRRHLKLEDSNCITSLPNTNIFEQLALMGHVSDSVADETTFISVDVDARGAATTDIGLDAGQGSGTIHKNPTRPHDSPLLRVHTLGGDEGSLQQNELMDFITKLTDRVEVLENDLQQTKKVYSSALTKLILIMKKLEKKVKTSKARRRANMIKGPRIHVYDLSIFNGHVSLAQWRDQVFFILLSRGRLKGKSFDEIQKLFEKEMKRVNTFVAMGSEVQESKEKKVEGSEETAKSSRKKMLGRKRAGKEQQQESSKKQRMEEDKESDEVEEVEEAEL
ncbi:hypothetical protein Tco_1056981 [Tanacetum coccineum]|uniref:Xylulose kinase-1 n=1 Tax=Tanacetum coccineum TaxID=301880 RepID=A0ABQ5H4U8_9ASTR